MVRQWAPRVWLAPGENFKPSNVETFLDNVCVADGNRKCIFPKLNSDISLSSTEAWSLNTVQPIGNTIPLVRELGQTILGQIKL